MTPSEEHVCFYHELGLAIAQWARVETNLFELVSHCVENEDRDMISYGFFAIENFRSKLEFASGMISIKFEDSPHIGDWKDLNARIYTWSQNRNQLAHRRVHIFTKSDPGRQYALVPWPKLNNKDAKWENHQLPPPGALCVRDIINIRYEFFKLNLDLENFSARLRNYPEPFPEHAVQPLHLPEIHELKAQIHVILGHPQQSSREKQRELDAVNAAASLNPPTGESNA